METPLTNLDIPIKKSAQSSFIKLILMIFNIIQIIHIFFTHLIDISPFYNYVLIFLGETYLLFIWSELREDDSYKNYLITIIASVILIILSFYYSIDALNYSYAFPLILILEYIIFYSSLIIIPISIIVFILVNYNYYYNILE
jgi:hypothetical protein